MSISMMQSESAVVKPCFPITVQARANGHKLKLIPYRLRQMAN